MILSVHELRMLPWSKVRKIFSPSGECYFSLVEVVGGGVFECKINFGPGYRVYFDKDSVTLIVLLTGGTKKQHQADIKQAKELWLEYKKRKKEG